MISIPLFCICISVFCVAVAITKLESEIYKEMCKTDTMTMRLDAVPTPKEIKELTSLREHLRKANEDRYELERKNKRLEVQLDIKAMNDSLSDDTYWRR